MITTTAMKGFRRIYLSCALVLLNTLVIFALVNAGLFAAIFVRNLIYFNQVAAPRPIAHNQGNLFNPDGSPVNNGRRSAYQLEWFDFNAYENIGADYAAQVLDDFYALSKLGFIYQPWVQFSEPPFTGKLVNVDLDPRGFPVRRTVNVSNNQGLPVVQIFTLGGSTTFGYNVSDEHTWPSYLSKVLHEKARAEGLGIHVEVTNYGRGFYNPSQETALIADLLKNGHRPQLVIFMDGVNFGPFQDVPPFTARIARQVKNIQFISDTPILKRFQWLPIVRLANSIRRRLLETNTDNKTEMEQAEDLRRVENVLNLFDQNRDISTAICNLYAAKTLFFLQPNPEYNYSVELYRRSMPDSIISMRNRKSPVYDRLRGKSGRIYLGDLFERWGHDRKAIIDDVHYSPSFNQFLAVHVASYINLKTLKPRALLIDESAVTGGRRALSS